MKTTNVRLKLIVAVLAIILLVEIVVFLLPISNNKTIAYQLGKAVLLKDGTTTAGDGVSAGLVYTVTDEKITIAGYTGTDTSVSIPVLINSMPVVAIGDGAFKDNTSITEINITEGSMITTIGNYAFSGCTKLENFSFPESLTTIGSYAFNNCESLIAIPLYENITSIGNHAFAGCIGPLEDVAIPTGVTSLGEGIFEGCTDLTTVYIPKGVTTIDANLFGNPSNLTKKITIITTEGSVADNTFKNDTEHFSIEVYSSYPSINLDQSAEGNIFGADAKIGYIVSDQKASSDPEADGEDYIESVKLVTTQTTLPLITTISRESFTEYEYVEGVARYEIIATNKVGNITTVKFSIGVSDYTFTEDGSSVTITGYTGTDTSVVIPSKINEKNVTTIASGAFNNTSVTDITIPATVTQIADYAFTKTTESHLNDIKSITVDGNNTVYSSVDGVLFNKEKTQILFYPSKKENTSYEIPTTVTDIEDYSFSDCDNITSLTIPSSVKNIKANAFWSSDGFTEIGIPSSVESINAMAFCTCAGLSSITVDANNTNYSSENGVLFNKDKTEIKTYPRGKSETSYEIPDNVKVIGEFAFYNNDKLANIILPYSTESINANAFTGCSSLTRIAIPKNVTSVASNCADSVSDSLEFIYKSGTAGETFAEGKTTKTSDDVAPVISEIEHEGSYNSAVTPNITDNIALKYITLKKAGEIVSDYTNGSSISENGEYEIEAGDLVGNVTTMSFSININTVTNTYSLSNAEITLDGSSNKQAEISLISELEGTFIGFEGNWSLKENTETTYLTLAELTPGGELQGNPSENDSNTGRVVWSDGSGVGFNVTAGGTIWKAKYTIDKDTPEGDYYVELNNYIISAIPEGYSFDEENGKLTGKITVSRDVNTRVLDKIEVTTYPDKMDYIVGESFEPDGMVITAYYVDGSSNVITDYNIDVISNFTLENKTVTITYAENEIQKATSFEVNVTENTIVKNIIGIEITQEPNKTAYVVEEQFNPTGMIVSAVYDDGSKEEITGYVVEGGDNLQLETTSVTIKYEKDETEYTATQPISVTETAVEPTFKRLEIATAPNKTQYNIGENFDPTGMTISAIYDNETIVDITEYTVLDGDNLALDKTEVTIKCEIDGTEQTVTQPITVIDPTAEPTLVGIEITTLPTKLDYAVGETFDPTGMVVTALYSNNDSKAVTNFTVYNGMNMQLGQTSVIIGYTENDVEKTATVNITVSEATASGTLTSIEIVQAPNKTVYTTGQTFNRLGMIVIAKYSNGMQKEITNYTIINGAVLKQNQTSVKIKYEEGGVEKTTTQDISVVGGMTITTRKVVSIEVTGAPEKTEYFAGESFNRKGMVVTATFDDGSTGEIRGYSVLNGKNLTRTQKTVIISYSSGGRRLTAEQEIVVNKREDVENTTNQE